MTELPQMDEKQRSRLLKELRSAPYDLREDMVQEAWLAALQGKRPDIAAQKLRRQELAHGGRVRLALDIEEIAVSKQAKGLI